MKNRCSGVKPSTARPVLFENGFHVRIVGASNVGRADAVAVAVQRGNAMAIRSAWERMMHISYEQRAVSTAQTLQSVDSRDAATDEYDEPEGGHDEMQRLSMSQSMTATSMIECVS